MSMLDAPADVAGFNFQPLDLSDDLGFGIVNSTHDNLRGFKTSNPLPAEILPVVRSAGQRKNGQSNRRCTQINADQDEMPFLSAFICIYLRVIRSFRAGGP